MSDPQASGPSRREFLKFVTLAPAATYANRLMPQDKPQDPKSDTQKVFEGINLTDQYGQPFDPSRLFADKTALLAFGYGGCPMCNEINKTIAHSQEALSTAEHNVPLVVISVIPEQDNDNAQTRLANVKSLFLSGIDLVPKSELEAIVTQLEAEKAKAEKREPKSAKAIIGDISGVGDVGREARETLVKQYDIIGAIAKMENSQRKRSFNHVMPASAKDAQELQKRLAKIAGWRTSGTSSRNPRQHTRYLTLLDRGSVVQPEGGPIVGAVLNRKTESFEASSELIREQTQRMVSTMNMLEEARKEAQKERGK